MKKKTAKSKETIPFFQEVHLLDPKPNKMFPQWMTDRLRFLRFYNAVARALNFRACIDLVAFVNPARLLARHG